MVREDIAKILAIIQAAYPNYRPTDKTATLNTWFVIMQEYGYEDVSTALKMYITSDTSGFAPAIGQIIGMIQRVKHPEQLNEMEAWVLVSRALRNGYYGAEEEFAKLPAVVQRAVGSPSQLRNWSQTDMESVENVIQSNFLRTYRAVAVAEKETDRMPQDVRNKIETVNIGRQKLTGDAAVIKEKPQRKHKGVPAPEKLLNDFKREMKGS